MKRKITSLLIAVSGLLGSALSGHAATTSDYTLYTPEAWVIGVSGDTAPLLDAAASDRYIVNPVSPDYQLPLPAEKGLSVTQIQAAEAALNANDVGRKVLDWLLCYDATAGTISDSRLLERAALNRTLSGQPPVAETELKKELAPLLTHNYIYLERKIYFNAPTGVQIDSAQYYYTVYAMFAIEASESLLSKAVEQGDATLYRSVPVTVKCVKSGHAGIHTNIANMLSKSVPALAPMAMVVSDGSEVRIPLGRNEGMKNGNLVCLYRAVSDKEGLPVSERLGYARLRGVTDSGALLEYESRGARRVNEGDVAIYGKGQKNFSLRLEGLWQKKMWGGTVGFGMRVATNRWGYAWKVFLEGGFSSSGSDKSEKSYLPDDPAIMHYFADAGVGLSKKFGGIVEIMPSVGLGCSYADVPISGATTYSKKCTYLRIPIAVTAGLNVCYPLQVVFTAGYTPFIDLQAHGGPSVISGFKLVDQICKRRGVGLDGFFMRLGLQLNI